MKRSSPTIWLLLALIVAGLFLLRGLGERPGVGDASASIAPLPAEIPARDSGREVEPVGDGTIGNPERREVAGAAPARSTTLRVLGPDGEPIAGARVLLAREASILLDGETDALGEVGLASDARIADMVAVVEARPPEHREVRLDAGTQQIRLTAGSLVSGWLVGEDGEGARGLHVSLDGDHPDPAGAAIPQIVWEALGSPLRHRVPLSATTAADGGFEFSGLPPTWSGSLDLPQDWKVLSTTRGQIEPYARGVRLAQPAAGLSVRVVRQRTLRGRLVSSDDGEPLGGATLTVMLRSPDADSSHFTQVTTDPEGRFVLRREHERLSLLDIRLGAVFRESRSILLLDAAAIPVNGDLGQIVVDEVRNVPFLLLDPTGTPIAGGKAIAAGTRSEGTGKDGLSVLRWLPRSADRMRVEASGYVPTQAEIPILVPEPLVVTMQPANRLEVRVIPPQESDPRQFKVVLRREGGVAAAPIEDRVQQHAHVGEWAYAPYDLTLLSPDEYLVANPDAARGVAVFRALRPGVELELEIRGITGKAVFHRQTLQPLSPSEVRRLEVRLGDGMRTFRGRVLSLDGAPLERASLQLGNRILGWTDEQGEFLCFLLDEEPQTFLIQHQACSTLFLHDWVAPAGAEPVEFRLHPARRVTIEVVDEAGNPVPQAKVWIAQEGFTTNTHPIAGNRHVATSLTDNPFEIVTHLAGRVYRQEHSSQIPEARVVVPVHGSLVAIVSSAASDGLEGSLQLVLTPADTEPAEPVIETRPCAPNLRITMPAVHPGVYQASLQYEPSPEERAAGLETRSSDPVQVTIEAGKESQLRLGLPSR